MKQVFRHLLSFLFPHTCPICGKVIEDDKIFCHSCLQSLPRTEQAIIRDNMTEELFRDIRSFVRGAAFLHFRKDDITQELTHLFKYGNRPDIATALTEEAIGDLLAADFFDEIDIIMPIPLHPRRLRERGYNQSEYIARALGKATGIPVDCSHLVRKVNNPKQATKNASERIENVKDIFEVRYPEDLYHKHVLLVDDIITTGSTLRSCMKTLRACRSCKVSVFALGKAV